MKKLLKALATLAAVAMLGTSFIGCASDDDGGSKGGNGGGGAGTTFGTTTIDALSITAPAEAGSIKIGETTYGTIQEALNACTGSSVYNITLGKGTYAENALTYNGSATIKITGTGDAKFGTDVLIIGKGSSQDSEKERSLLEITGSANLILENVTLKNNFVREGSVPNKTQCEALGFDSTGTCAAYNCSFLSHQDTIRTLSKSWFYNCHIEGDVDFIWMETAGKVALYEECEIVALTDEVDVQYIIAPGMTQTTKINKGVVIYNSKIKGNDKTYLFRSPWSVGSGKYNNGAFVNCSLDGSLNGDLVPAGNIADGIGNQSKVGWKVDAAIAAKYPSKNSTIGTIPAADISNEFNGRRTILNRYYDKDSEKYAKDYDNFWDIDALITSTGWNVTADTSKDLLAGETAVTTKTYVLDSVIVEGITCTGFALENGKTHYVGSANATIEVPVTGKCSVVVTGYYKGNGEISAEGQGSVVYDYNNSSTTKFIEKEYVVYNAAVTKVVIKATVQTYITKIVVKYDNSISFKPVTSIAVSCSDDDPTVGKPAKVIATVNPATASNKDVTWSTSNASVATVDANTGAVAFKSVGEVTITATARDGSGVTGAVVLSPKGATWTEAEWYFTKDGSASLGSGIGCVATDVAGKENSAFSTKNLSGIGIGAKKAVTTLEGSSVEISTGLKMDGNGELYITVGKAATLTVKQAYIDTGSKKYSGYLVIASADGGSATAAETNPTAAISGDVEYVWTLTPGSYTVKRNSGDTGTIYYAKCVLSE